MGFLDIFKISKIKQENEQLKKELEESKRKFDELGCGTYLQVLEKTRNYESYISDLEHKISEEGDFLLNLQAQIRTLSQSAEKAQKQYDSQKKKLNRAKELYSSVDYCIKTFLETDRYEQLSRADAEEFDEFAPSVMLKLHCMDIKDLRKAYRENDKLINQVLTSYASRYTTKSNRAIYQLMVIALRAELQNILYDLKYEKLDVAIENVKTVTGKYLKIAGEGNQSIVGTLTKFIGELEYLFINAVKIEYNYYVKKEQARQEQLAIKQQMREEAEERRLLEQQRKKIEQEESKYQNEIDKVSAALAASSDDKQIADLQARILELQGQLLDVTVKKEEITRLQNGKAGYVYIISNLGSFGENVFKIGMTRRENPKERIDELGSASVPFQFDVHSTIFSDDAVALENKLHHMLDNKRVNKVNCRKEFFYSSIDELENLARSVDPSCEFIRTMAAEEFRQSQSVEAPYSSDFEYGPDDEDDSVL